VVFDQRGTISQTETMVNLSVIKNILQKPKVLKLQLAVTQKNETDIYKSTG
jgi:hypothetical protein